MAKGKEEESKAGGGREARQIAGDAYAVRDRLACWCRVAASVRSDSRRPTSDASAPVDAVTVPSIEIAFSSADIAV